MGLGAGMRMAVRKGRSSIAGCQVVGVLKITEVRKTHGLWLILNFSFSCLVAIRAAEREGRKRKERERNYVSRRAPAASGRCGRREGQGAAVGDVTWAPEAGAEVGVG